MKADNGAGLLQAGESERALPLLEAKLAERPHDFRVLSNLAVCHRNLQHLDSALEYAQRAIHCPGGDRQAGLWNNLGMLLEDYGQFTRALQAYDFAHALDSRTQLFALNLAYSLMRFQRFDEGWPLWLSSRLMQTWVPIPGIPIWEAGENIRGKRLLVHCDGGDGDAIMFARWFRHLRMDAVSVTAVCAPAVAALYVHCDWLAEVLPTDAALAPQDYDYQCALMDLPALLGVRTANDFAIGPPPFPLHRMALRCGGWATMLRSRPRPRIGVCWYAEEKTVQRKHRSIPFKEFLPILGLKATWIPLCPGQPECSSELFSLDPTPLLTDWVETADLISQLDWVITVDTAVAHLAATLRKRTWILIPRRSDWKWFIERKTSPLYGSVRLFRQTDDPLSWQGTINQLVVALTDQLPLVPR